MKHIYIFLLTACTFISFSSIANDDWKALTEDPAYMHRTMKEITDVIVHDIYSPPVASRIYTYVSVAGYEAAIHANKNYFSLAGQLHELNTIPAPDASKQYCFQLSAVHAMLLTAKALVISEEKIKDFDSVLMQEYKNSGIPQEVFENSSAYGKTIADFILAWAAKDHYKEIRSLPAYTVSDDAGTWKPTPPTYMKAIEPHWKEIRTFLLDSCSEFKPLPALPFSTDTISRFYKEAKAVHDAGVQLSDEQKAIASFWDCNPFKMNVNGHVMFATKKISPGGHWINITALACKKVNADFVRSAEAYACVAITLADAFISCWDEKFRSNVIRPETYINQYIDENWMPLLQTPPFPEYTSGHSVVSTAASVVLTKMFGDNFSFTDSTEKEFELPERHFNSFKEAANEAAISRFYGGIHYMPSINSGITEGEQIGNFIIKKLRVRG